MLYTAQILKLQFHELCQICVASNHKREILFSSGQGFLQFLSQKLQCISDNCSAFCCYESHVNRITKLVVFLKRFLGILSMTLTVIFDHFILEAFYFRNVAQGPFHFPGRQSSGLLLSSSFYMYGCSEYFLQILYTHIYFFYVDCFICHFL